MTRQAELPDLFNAIAGWLETRGMRGITFYSPVEWEAKGERICTGAAAHAVIDDCQAFFALLNSVGTADEDTFKSFNSLLDSLGYWHELGHMWSVHFYTVEG